MNDAEKVMEDLPPGVSVEMFPDRLLLRVADRRTKAGLVLPGASAQKMDEAIVVRAGKPKEEDWIGPSLEGGERVLFFRSGAVPVEIEKTEYLFVHYHDIFCTISYSDVECSVES